MAVPRNRTSNARKNSRRSHHAKKPRAVAACPQCGKLRMSHQRCPHCSAYNGRLTVEA